MGPNSCSSPSMQQQQQQGPPPPYGGVQMPGSGGKSKLQKAGVPEKFDKMQANKGPQQQCMPGSNTPGSLEQDMFMLKNPSGGSITTSGLQTTPSPQLMSYMEFEGQELTITKQLNTSYKGNMGDEQNDSKMSQFASNNNSNPGPNNSNSVILNILNTSNSQNANSSSLNDNLLLSDDSKQQLIKSESIESSLLNDQLNGNSDLATELHLNQQQNPAQHHQHRHHEHSTSKKGLKHQNSNSQLQQQQHQDPFFNNSNAGLGNFN